MSKTVQLDDDKELSLNTLKHNNVINISWPERLISSTAGALLLSSGVNNLLQSPVKSIFKTIIGGYLMYRGASGNCPVYTAIGKNKNVHRTEPIVASVTMTIDKPADEVYMFWRKLENLPIFMEHLSDVIERDSIHSHWEAFLPGRLGKIKWNAQIIRDEYGSVITWQSIGGSSIENAGKVTFTPITDQQTELNVIIVYRPPAGDIGSAVGNLFNGTFETMVKNDIYRFKDYIEGRLIAHEAIDG